MVDVRSSDRGSEGELLRLWIEFGSARKASVGDPVVIGIIGTGDRLVDAACDVGCGVSGYDEPDCLRLIREQVFGDRPLPPIRRSVPDVDVSTLPTPLQKLIGVTVHRGVWFPI